MRLRDQYFAQICPHWYMSITASRSGTAPACGAVGTRFRARCFPSARRAGGCVLGCDRPQTCSLRSGCQPGLGTSPQGLRGVALS